ncbi:MAG: hypothetical protein MUF16_01005 [Burkholderiaceae bacterium]|jgi:hypothetical protein|nr:hypothetical protein [Burkholderiaceae bacterium]
MAIRLKSQWFKTDTPKSPQQAAGAMAFIVWRVAHNTLTQMRSAQFDIDIGPMYFDFMREWLVFLVQVTDRMAHARMASDERVAFTTALVHRVADHLADNESNLLGPLPAGQDSYQGRFIDLCNELSAHYAEFGHGAQGPDFAFMRYLGSRIEALMPAKDRAWALDQVMSIEAPEAVAMLQRSLDGVLSTEPRKPRRAGLSGD